MLIRYLCILVALIACATDLYAQSNTCANNDQLVLNTSTKLYQCITPGSQPAGTGTTMIVANAGTTGTTVNRFAKLTGAPSTALITATTDTENAIGIVTSGAGTTGNATITILGQASCQFDGATTAGDYVTISTATAGMCHDAGSTYPTSGATYGRVLSTNGGAGTYVMELMTPDIAFQNAGNGKSRPAGSGNEYQYNSSNQFGAGNLFREDANTVAQRNSTTAQVLNLYQTFTNASNYSRLALQNNGGGAFELNTQSAGSGTLQRLEVKIGSTSGFVFQNSNFSPITNNGHSLGSSSLFWNGVFSSGVINGSTNGYQWQSRAGIYSNSSSNVRLTDQGAGDTSDMSLSFGGTSSNSPMFKRQGTTPNLELRVANDSTQAFLIDAGRAFTSAQFDKTDTTLANVTGLTATLTAAKTYSFEAVLFVDADVTGGSKYAIAGTATATAIKYHVDTVCDATNLLVITSRQTALAGSVGQAGCTAGLTKISGTITVNAAGTLTVQFAQNTASGTSSVLTMSKFEVRQLN